MRKARQVNIIPINNTKNHQSFGIKNFIFYDKYSEKAFYAIPGVREAESRLLGNIKPEYCNDVPVVVEAITEELSKKLSKNKRKILHFWFNVKSDRGVHTKVNQSPNLSVAEIEPSLNELMKKYSKCLGSGIID